MKKHFIMRNNHHRSFKTIKCGDKSVTRLNIQMIGRFIK